MSEYEKYVFSLKKEIDGYLSKQDYKKAFHRFVAALTLIEERDVLQFVEYYERSLHSYEKETEKKGENEKDERSYFL